MKLEELFEVKDNKYLIKYNKTLKKYIANSFSLPSECKEGDLRIVGIFCTSKEAMLEGLKAIDPSKHRISHWPNETFLKLLLEWPELCKKYILASCIPSITASLILSRNPNISDNLPSIEEEPTMLIIWEKLPMDYLLKHKTIIFKFALAGDTFCRYIIKNKFKEETA